MDRDWRSINILCSRISNGTGIAVLIMLNGDIQTLDMA
jgi:hypothetical protein